MILFKSKSGCLLLDSFYSDPWNDKCSGPSLSLWPHLILRWFLCSCCIGHVTVLHTCQTCFLPPQHLSIGESAWMALLLKSCMTSHWPSFFPQMPPHSVSFLWSPAAGHQIILTLWISFHATKIWHFHLCFAYGHTLCLSSLPSEC